MRKVASVMPMEVLAPLEGIGWDEIMQREAADPADVMVEREDQAAMNNALKSLPTVNRTAVELYDIEGLPCERISEIMACPLESVQSRILEGHSQIKRTFESLEKVGNKA